MGRQKGQSNRSKKDIKSSSSSLAAGRLSGAGGAVGFQSLGGDLGYLPLLKGADDGTDSSVDSDFKVALSKLYKRDSTTKLKALADFVKLCDEKDPKETAAVLPYWPRLYVKLSQDSDRRVRELSHNALRSLLKHTGKETAVYLKSFIGCWWVSNHDMYAPAASASQLAFEEVFPTDEKRVKAVHFCAKEIVDTVNVNLFYPRISSNDNSETILEDIYAPSLKSLASFIKLYDPDKVKKDNEVDLSIIFNNSKFWKFAKDKSPTVRSSFYLLLCNCCTNANYLLQDQCDVLCKTVFSRLNEADPLVTLSIWAAASKITKVFQDWHQVINVRKVFLPNFLSCIKAAFHGNANQCAQYLLPILSCFPPEMIFAKPVIDELFNAFSAGLQCKTLECSRSEVKAFTTSIMECIQFVVRSCFESRHLSAPNIEMATHVLNSKLLPLLDSTLSDCESNVFRDVFLKLMSDFIRILANKASDQKQGPSQYEEIFSILFDHITDIGKGILLRIGDDAGESVNKLMSLLKQYTSFLTSIDNVSYSKGCSTTKPKSKSVRIADTKHHDGRRTNLASVADLTLGEIYLYRCVRNCMFDLIENLLSLDLLALTKLLCLEILLPTLNLALHELQSDVCDLRESEYQGFEFVKQTILPLVLEVTSANIVSDKFEGTIANVLNRCILSCDSNDVIPLIFDQLHTADATKANSYYLTTLTSSILSSNHSDCAWLHTYLLSETNEVVAYLVQNIPNFIQDKKSIRLLHDAVSSSIYINFDQAMRCLDTISMTMCHVISNKSHNSLLTDLAQITIDVITQRTLDIDSTNVNKVLKCLMIVTTSLIKTSCETNLVNTSLVVDIIQVGLSCLNSVCVQFEMISIDGDLSSSKFEFMQHCCKSLKSLVENGNADYFHVQNLTQVIIFAAEKQNCKALVESILFTGEDLDLFRPSLNSASWVDNTKLVNCDYIPIINHDDQNDYGADGSSTHEKRARFANGAIKIAYEHIQGQSELLSNFVSSTQVIDTMIESLIVNDNTSSSSQNHLWFLTKPLLLEKMLTYLINKSVENGGGWLLALSKLLTYAEVSAWNSTGIVFELLKTTEKTPHLFNCLLTCSANCTDAALLSEICDFLMPKLMWCLNDLNDETVALVQLQASLHMFSLSKLALRIKTLTKNCPEFMASMVDVVSKLLCLKSDAEEMFIFDKCILSESYGSILWNIACSQVFSMVVELDPSLLDRETWDFPLCSLVSWLESINISLSQVSNTQKLLTSTACMGLLYSTLSQFQIYSEFLNSDAAKSDPSLPGNLTNEWSDFFQPTAHASLLPVFLKLGGESHPNINVVLPLLYNCLVNIAGTTVVSSCSDLDVYLTPDSDLPEFLQTLLHHFSKFLIPASDETFLHCMSTCYICLMNVIQDYSDSGSETAIKPPSKLLEVISYHTNHRTMSAFTNDKVTLPSTSTAFDNDDTADDSDDEADLYPAQIEYEATVSKLNTSVSYATYNLNLVDISQFPYKDFCKALSCLLSWTLIMKMGKQKRSQSRAEYFSHLMNNSSLKPLLENIACFLPNNPIVKLQNGKDLNLFEHSYEKVVQSDATLSPNQLAVFSSACCLYKELLVNFPVNMRTWFNDLNKVQRTKFDDYTSKYLSPLLSRNELKLVTSTKSQEGLTIQTRPTTGEVHVSYLVSDAEFEILISLASNHPLDPVKVNTIKRVGVSSGQWRYWVLQMTTLLLYQNGSILDALLFWKEKVDKKLDGIEECMICFSVVHGSSTQSLPKLACKTCHKKFHAECLYKWFDTSNQSTCPLCRTPMIFR